MNSVINWLSLFPDGNYTTYCQIKATKYLYYNLHYYTKISPIKLHFGQHINSKMTTELQILAAVQKHLGDLEYIFPFDISYILKLLCCVVLCCIVLLSPSLWISCSSVLWIQFTGVSIREAQSHSQPPPCVWCLLLWLECMSINEKHKYGSTLCCNLHCIALLDPTGVTSHCMFWRTKSISSQYRQ